MLSRKERQKGFMFDTNIFDAFLDGEIRIDSLPKNIRYYVTHIQEDELGKTKNEIRKEALLLLFNRLDRGIKATEAAVFGISKYGCCKYGKGVKIPTETAIWDVSKWDECKWDSGVKIPNESFSLDALKLDNKTYFEVLKNGNLKHTEDALIGETAIVNNLILVSNDAIFRNKVKRLGGEAISFNDFIASVDDKYL